MKNLYEVEKRNAEGYCRECGQPLGISGQCVVCAIDYRVLDKVRTRTTVILAHETPSTRVDIHRGKRRKFQSYETHVLTKSSARRLRCVLRLPIWGQVVEFDDDELSHTVYLHSEKPVVKS